MFEFYSCRGNVRAITKNQRNIRGESKFCHENCLLLTSGLWLNQCLMGYCRLCVAFLKDFICILSQLNIFAVAYCVLLAWSEIMLAQLE